MLKVCWIYVLVKLILDSWFSFKSTKTFFKNIEKAWEDYYYDLEYNL